MEKIEFWQDVPEERVSDFLEGVPKDEKSDFYDNVPEERVSDFLACVPEDKESDFFNDLFETEPGPRQKNR